MSRYYQTISLSVFHFPHHWFGRSRKMNE
jgi:hypothetical protein